jgi:hypothetical protein
MLLALVADQVTAGEWPTARLPEAGDTHRA